MTVVTHDNVICNAVMHGCTQRTFSPESLPTTRTSNPDGCRLGAQRHLALPP